jgi:glutaredoxin
MKKILATSATCGPCQMIKTQIEQLGISVETKNYSDSANIPWFREKGVRSVPLLIIEDINGNEVERISGAEQILSKLKND